MADGKCLVPYDGGLSKHGHTPWALTRANIAESIKQNLNYNILKEKKICRVSLLFNLDVFDLYSIMSLSQKKFQLLKQHVMLIFVVLFHSFLFVGVCLYVGGH